MFGFKDLKNVISVKDNSVECPVLNCTAEVARQRKVFKRDLLFQCPVHKIFISPSTFEYESDSDNLLWQDQSDIHLLSETMKYKRESRIARDNSEDALSWNIFRYLDKEGLLLPFLSQLSDNKVQKAELIFWSFSQNERTQYSLLNKARLEFGETIARGSEPDIIILTDNILYFIEAKLLAKNETKPSNINNRKRYEKGGDCIFRNLFRKDYETIAIKEQKYELMRFWLLGSWMAKIIGINFELFNLVLQDSEQNVENEFGKLIIETSVRKFRRITWESIYTFILTQKDCSNRANILEYFQNKTLGYDSNHRIIKAFNL